jgi:hypothetical protein
VRLGRDYPGGPKLTPRFQERTREPQHPEPFLPWDRTPGENTGQQMRRCRQWRTVQNRSAAVPIEADQLERRLDAHVIRGADRREKRQRLAIAAEEHVLAVVHELAGVAIAKCRRAPAELRPRIENQHPRAAARQRARGAEAGETAAYDDDVVA